MTTQEQERNRLHNKSLVEHFVRLAWNSGKFNLLKQLVTSDFVCHQNNLDGFLDIDSFIEYVKEIRFAVPDLTVTIEDLVVEGNKAFLRGIHQPHLLPAGQVVPPGNLEVHRLVQNQL